MINALGTLFELENQTISKTKNPLSTLSFDWLYTILGILLTVGILMDVWSHTEFGPDQSIFNEYHLLFYGSMGAILLLLTVVHTGNVRRHIPFAHALPQGYGIGMLATLLFGLSGIVDLTGHALYGFETGIEALISPTHLLLFVNWFLILYAPVRAYAARLTHQDKPANLIESLPMLICAACMLFTLFIPVSNAFQMGGEPVYFQNARPANDDLGVVFGVTGILFQTILMMGFLLWLVRQFRLPRGSFTLILGLFGLFISVLGLGLPEIIMYIVWVVLLDILYGILKPDGAQPNKFISFGFLGALAMWTCALGTYGLFFGFNAFWFSGYNLYGAVAQACVMSTIVAYMLSLKPAEPRFAKSRFTEVS